MREEPRGSEWRWLWKELRPHPRPQLLAIGALLGATLLSLVDPLVMKWLIDQGLQRRDWSAVVTALGVFCAAYLARMLLIRVGTLTQVRVIQRVTFGIRLRLLRRLQGMDAAFYDRHAVGDLVQRVEQDVDQVGQAGANFLPSSARIVLSLSATLAIMAALDWRLTTVVIPFIPVLLLVRVHFRGALGRAADVSREAIGTRASFLTESLGGSIQAQLLGAEPYFRRKYSGFAAAATRAAFRQWMTEVYYSVATLAAMTAVVTVVLLFGAQRFMAGALTLGGYIAFYTYVMRLFDPLSSAVEMHVALKRAGGSIRRVAALESYKPTVADQAGAQPLRPGDVDRVSVGRASFEYAQGKPVLRDLELHLRRGERAALVGRSGDGKSTLAKLLVRMYDPQAGEVRLGGVDVCSATLRSIRNAATLVPATPMLFKGTIRENALLGRRGITEARLEQLAWVTCFDTVLDKFTDRWEHVLGPAGAGLSDGEKQRLGLLRALLRDAPVLILDEATGALDPAIERDVLSRLDELIQDRTVLVITHRPATAAWCERLLVIRNGRLCELASEDALLLQASTAAVELWEPEVDHPVVVAGAVASLEGIGFADPNDAAVVPLR